MDVISSVLLFILKLANYLSENFFLISLMLGEAVYVYYLAHKQYVDHMRIAGSIAVTLFILHAGWASAAIPYIAFLKGLVAELAILCVLAYLLGRALRYFKGNTH